MVNLEIRTKDKESVKAKEARAEREAQLNAQTKLERQGADFLEQTQEEESRSEKRKAEVLQEETQAQSESVKKLHELLDSEKEEVRVPSPLVIPERPIIIEVLPERVITSPAAASSELKSPTSSEQNRLTEAWINDPYGTNSPPEPKETIHELFKSLQQYGPQTEQEVESHRESEEMQVDPAPTTKEKEDLTTPAPEASPEDKNQEQVAVVQPEIAEESAEETPLAQKQVIDLTAEEPPLTYKMVQIIEEIEELHKEINEEKTPTEAEIQANLALRKNAKQKLVISDPEQKDKGKAKADEEPEMIQEMHEENTDDEIDLEANDDIKSHLNEICNRMDLIWNAAKKKKAENRTLYELMQTSKALMREQRLRLDEYAVQTATIESLYEAEQARSKEFSDRLNQTTQCAVTAEDALRTKEQEARRLQLALNTTNERRNQAEAALDQILSDPMMGTSSSAPADATLKQEIERLKAQVKAKDLQLDAITATFMDKEQQLNAKCKQLQTELEEAKRDQELKQSRPPLPTPEHAINLENLPGFQLEQPTGDEEPPLTEQTPAEELTTELAQAEKDLSKMIEEMLEPIQK